MAGEFRIDASIREFRAIVRQIARQPRFATAKALNEIAQRIRDNAIHHTFPMGFNLKNRALPRGILKTMKAVPEDLSAAVYDRDRGLEYLPRHDTGGIKSARSGFGVAIPDDPRKTPLRSTMLEHSNQVGKRTARGMPKAETPKALLNEARLNALTKGQSAGSGVVRRNGKWVAPKTKRGRKARMSEPFVLKVGQKQLIVRRNNQSKRLSLLYFFKPTATIRDDDFLWTEDATRIARLDMPKVFAKQMQAALATAQYRGVKP